MSAVVEARMRAQILEGMCPICGRGPWKSPAVHTARMHGVGAAELREMAGLNRRTPITSPETHEMFSMMNRPKYVHLISTAVPGNISHAPWRAEGRANQSKVRRAATSSPEARALLVEQLRKGREGVDWSELMRRRFIDHPELREIARQSLARTKREHPEKFPTAATKVCAECGREFRHRPPTHNKRYCGRECFKAARRAAGWGPLDSLSAQSLPKSEPSARLDAQDSTSHDCTE